MIRSDDPRLWPHVLVGDDCWCNPERLQVCPECEEQGKNGRGCFRCGGRGVVAADQGFGQAVRVIDVVKAEPPFYT